MQLGVCKRMHAPLRAARAWPLWELPRWLTGYIVAVVVAYLAVLSVVGQFYTAVPAPDRDTRGPAPVRRRHRRADQTLR